MPNLSTIPALTSKALLTASLPFLAACVLYRTFLSVPTRPTKVPYKTERVLIVGGSSGIGRTMARQYVERGARVCVLGRREELLLEVEEELKAAFKGATDNKDTVLAIKADFTEAEDMVRVRAELLRRMCPFALTLLRES